MTQKILITDICHGLEPITVILDFWKYSLLEKQSLISELEFFLKDQGSNFQVQYWMGCVFLLMSITSSCENSLSCLTESTRETSIGSGSILVIQLSRFSTSFSGLIKDQQVFNCSPELDVKVPITVEDEVSFSTKYSLMASINHSGTLDQGHYWAIVKDLSSGDWLSCNDKVVLTVPQHSLNNTTSYNIFTRKMKNC